jgi:hypothetical protein
MQDGRRMALVTSFENGREAYTYLRSFERKSIIEADMFNDKSYNFVITKSNFDIVYQTSDIESYLRFFDKNYRNGIFEEGQ